jgi:hypothetical protein
MNSKTWSICLFAVMVFGTQIQAEEAFHDKQSGLRFPKQMASLKFREHHKYDQAGLGYSVRYEDERFKIDVYVYDLSLKDIGSGSSSKRVGAELANTVSVLHAFEKQGKYKNVKELQRGKKKFSKDAEDVDFQWARYEYEQARSKDSRFRGVRISDTYLTAYKGKFVKVRLTFMKANLRKRDKDVEAFMKKLAQAMRGS